jgi:hypothetical protein
MQTSRTRSKEFNYYLIKNMNKTLFSDTSGHPRLFFFSDSGGRIILSQLLSLPKADSIGELCFYVSLAFSSQ